MVFAEGCRQIVAEVSLAPNLLSLYGCQSLYCLHIAKTPSPVTEIRRIRSTSGQHSSWHLYLPNRPGCLLVKRISQATTSLSAQSPGCLLAKRSLQVTTTWISVREIEAKGHDHPDGLLILLKIPLNCLFHSLCIQRICLCLISCNQLNCGDDSICNIILLLGHGTSDIGAVIY